MASNLFSSSIKSPGDFAKASLNSLGNAASTALTNLTEELTQGLGGSRYNAYKRSFGTGFKSNLWIVEIENLDDEIDQEYSLNRWFMQNMFNKSKKLEDVYSGFKKIINKIVPLTGTSGGNGFWRGLAYKTIIPGFDLEFGDEFSKFKKNVIGRTMEDFSITFINDQWNINYDFWHFYLSSITNGVFVHKYPDSYKCNITLKLLTTQLKTFYTIKLKNCTPFRINSVDLSYGKSDITDVTVDFNYEDYEMAYEYVQFLDIPAIGYYYADEMINAGLGTLAAIARDTSQILLSSLGEDEQLSTNLADQSNVINRIVEQINQINNIQKQTNAFGSNYNNMINSTLVGLTEGQKADILSRINILSNK